MRGKSIGIAAAVAGAVAVAAAWPRAEPPSEDGAKQVGVGDAAEVPGAPGGADPSGGDGATGAAPGTEFPDALPALLRPAKAACQTGCAVGNHPVEPLSEARYRELLAEVASGSARDRTRALETLLFHGADTRRFLLEVGTGPLALADAALLRREASRTHARVWMRLVGEGGLVRAHVDGARFPVGKKEHVHMETDGVLPSPEASGTVHRTGLHHLWTRM